MSSRLPVVALASVAVLGLATGCEKQNPYITVTAGGVVVKAKAVEYCRDGDCRKTNDVPTIKISAGDTLGIDVPRSLAEQGWSLGPAGPNTTILHDHYHAIPIGTGLDSGRLEIHRDTRHGVGVWQFNVVVE